jgi:hypothetical protein
MSQKFQSAVAALTEYHREEIHTHPEAAQYAVILQTEGIEEKLSPQSRQKFISQGKLCRLHLDLQSLMFDAALSV